MSEALFERAARGDETAFRLITEPYRRELLVHCYRMLGSIHDAEDALQEALLAAWRGLSGFEGRSSLRSWLYRIATNRCLNALRDAGRRPPAPLEPPFAAPAPTRRSEPTWLEPYPDVLLDPADPTPGPDVRYEQREAIELAFIAALQQLPPRQRAALVLRDVLGYRAAEAAEMLESSEESVKAALKRARATMDAHVASRRTKPPSPGSRQEMELAQRFADAFETDDIDAVVALLTHDAGLTMPPSTLEYQGHEAIGAFLREVESWADGHRNRLIPTRANSQPAFACYRTDPQAAIAHASGLIVLTLDCDRIAAITRFLDAGVLSRFGLPRTIPV